MSKNQLLIVSTVVFILISGGWWHLEKNEQVVKEDEKSPKEVQLVANAQKSNKSHNPFSVEVSTSQNETIKDLPKKQNASSSQVMQMQLPEHSIAEATGDEFAVIAEQEAYKLAISDDEITQRMPKRFADLLYNVDEQRKIQYKSFVDSKPDETEGAYLASRIREFITGLAMPNINLDSVQCNLALCEIRIEGANYPGGIVLMLSKNQDFPELNYNNTGRENLAMNRSNQDRTVFILWMVVNHL